VETHNLHTLHTILSTGSPLKAQSYEYVYRHVKSSVLLGSISGMAMTWTGREAGWRGLPALRVTGLVALVFNTSWQRLGRSRFEASPGRKLRRPVAGCGVVCLSSPLC
jgi:acyl-coenzyme A synthetase/AMP-(fatty) acid ligase